MRDDLSQRPPADVIDVVARFSSVARIAILVAFYELSVVMITGLVWLFIPIPVSVIYLISSMVMLAVTGFLLGRLQGRRQDF